MRIGIVAMMAAMAACPTLSAARAQPDCANWNSLAFFATAGAEDVRACLRAGADMIAVLLEAGADPDAQSLYGRPPLLNSPSGASNMPTTGPLADLSRTICPPAAPVAGCENWNNPDFFATAGAEDVRACLRAGADPEASSWGGYCRVPLHHAALGGNAAAIAVLLEAGAYPDMWDKDGKTPIYSAAQEGHAAAIMALLKAGADPDALTENGFTPLHLAAMEGDIAALLKAGADAQTKGGFTPLHDAAFWGHAAAIAALLEAGADPGARSKDGRIPFDLIPKNSPLIGTPVYRRLKDARRN